MGNTKDNKKKKAKTRLIDSNGFKSFIFITAVVVFCVIYYFVSPYIFAEKASYIDHFPLNVNGVASKDLEIYFIDVGQGDCTLVSTPDYKNILIDSGNFDDQTSNKVVDYLKSLGIKKLDYVIATHPDADHIGGFPKVFDKFKVGFVFRPYVKSTHFKCDMLKDRFNPPKAYSVQTVAYADFLMAVKNDRVNWVFSNKDTDLIFNYDTGKLKFDFLTPLEPVEEMYFSEPNDFSPLIKISYNDYSLMLTGDATTYIENQALEYYSSIVLDCDLLKIAHHGSDSSTSYDFLKTVSPDYAIISCSSNSDYGHPKQTVLSQLLSFDIKLYRTDKHGTIKLSVNSKGTPTIKTEKTCSGGIYSGY